MAELPHLSPKTKQRVVVCAALRNYVGMVIIGPRHYDPIMRAAIEADTNACIHAGDDPDSWRSAEQGFIDQWGTFMDRCEAFQVAKAAGQLRYGPHLSGERLDSSDLY